MHAIFNLYKTISDKDVESPMIYITITTAIRWYIIGKRKIYC